jgi:sphingomyelin phosphodiesterase
LKTRPGNNPTFKVYDVDPDTYEIMDAKVYRADIDDPNFHTSPSWTLGYSARQTYGSMLTNPSWPAASPLDAKFWHRVTEVFEKDRSAFDIYQGLRKGPGNGVEEVGCTDDDCWKDTICELRGMNVQYACRRSTPGLNIRRRDENGTEYLSRVHANAECAGAGISHVFHELPGRKVRSAAR